MTKKAKRIKSICLFSAQTSFFGQRRNMLLGSALMMGAVLSWSLQEQEGESM